MNTAEWSAAEMADLAAMLAQLLHDFGKVIARDGADASAEDAAA